MEASSDSELEDSERIAEDVSVAFLAGGLGDTGATFCLWFRLVCSLRLGGVNFCPLFFELRSTLSAQTEQGIILSSDMCFRELRWELSPFALPQVVLHPSMGQG